MIFRGSDGKLHKINRIDYTSDSNYFNFIIKIKLNKTLSKYSDVESEIFNLMNK
jgi:hypothetical protein